MLKSTKSQSHITPMRIRSVSKDFPSNSINMSQRELQEQIDLNYIGLRQNKNHVQCCSHQQSHGLPPKATQASALDKINLQLMMSGLNNELQRLIDTELKGALQNMKNDIQSQQFAFERQMCSVIGKMQIDLQKAGVSQQQQEQTPLIDLSEYALQKDLKDLELFVIKIAEQMEDNMNGYQLKQSQFLSEQNQTINEINSRFEKELQTIKEQQDTDNERSETLNSKVTGFESRFYGIDKKFEQHQILIDKNYDDLELQVRELRDDMRKEVLKLENMVRDQDEKNELDHAKIRQSLELIQSEDLTEKMRELEQLINSQESLTVMSNLVKKVEQIESSTEEDRKAINVIQEQMNEVHDIVDDIQQLKQSQVEQDGQIEQIQQQVEALEKIKQQLKDYDLEEIHSAIQNLKDQIDQIKDQQEQEKKRDQTELNKNYFLDQIEQLRVEISQYEGIKDQQEKQASDIDMLLKQIKQLEKQTEELKESEFQYKELIEEAHNNINDLRDLVEEQSHTVNQRIDSKADLEETSSMKQEIELLKEALQKLQLSNHQVKSQILDHHLSDFHSQLQIHEKQIADLTNMQSQLKQISADDEDAKHIEVIINQFRININAELDQIRKDLAELKKYTETNVIRIDSKDKEQDDRLESLELLAKNLEASILTSEKHVLNELDNKIKQTQEKYRQELEQLENACLNSLAAEILKQMQDNVQEHTYKPLVYRIESIEQQLEMRQKEVTPEKNRDEQLLSQHEIMHQRLLSEMKRKRLWYLRKTPQDHIIEEIMMQRRCTQEQAERYYLEQLEKKKVLREQNDQKITQDGAVLKSRHENIIHVSAGAGGNPDSSRMHTRSISRQQNEDFSSPSKLLGYGINPRGGSQNSRPTSARQQEIMRRPMSPRPDQVVEAAYEEANSILGTTPNKSPARAPYIVIHSPMHESAQKVVSNQHTDYRSQQQQQQTIGLSRVSPLQGQRLQYNTQQNDAEDDDDDIDESNVDVLELDEDNNQMRDNFSRMEQLRESYFERPLSSAFHKTFDNQSRLSEVSQQLHAERRAILKSTPFSVAQSAQKESAKRSHRETSQYQVQEVEEDWDNDEGFEIQHEEQKQEAEDELDQLDQIEDNAFGEPVDETYEGSFKYDYRESIRSNNQYQSQKVRMQPTLEEMEEDEQNQSFGDVNDLL